jgi:hypothetical protein
MAHNIFASAIGVRRIILGKSTHSINQINRECGEKPRMRIPNTAGFGTKFQDKLALMTYLTTANYNKSAA